MFLVIPAAVPAALEWTRPGAEPRGLSAQPTPVAPAVFQSSVRMPGGEASALTADPLMVTA